MKKLRVINERGSISVFQMIIISIILIFVLVIIDISRLYYAIGKLNSDVELATDSLMAHYDKYLMSEYQVFSLYGKDMDDIFLKYLKYNVYSNRTSLYNVKIDEDNTKVKGLENILKLGERDPLKEQIIEIMKYKAPIRLTEDLITKITKTSIFDKSKVASGANQVNKTSNEIYKTESSINYITNENNTIINKIKNEKFKRTSFKDDANKIKKYNEDLRILNLEIEKINKEIQKYQKQIDDINDDISKIEEKGVQPIFREFSDYRDKIIKLKNDVEENIENVEVFLIKSSEIEKKIIEYEIEIDLIKIKNNEYNENLKPLISIQESYQKEINNLEFANTIIEKGLSVLKLMDTIGINEGNSIEDGENQIQENELKINEINKQLSAIKNEIISIENTISKLTGDIIRIENKVDSEIVKINLILDETKINQIGILDIEKAIYNEEDRPKKEDQEKSNNIFNGFKNEIMSLYTVKKIPINWVLSSVDFEDANNVGGMGINDNSVFDFQRKDSEEVEEEIDKKTKLLDELFNAIKNTGENTVEKLFIIEYIMDKYTYHTSTANRIHYFRKGEVEYLLVGNENEIKNISKNFLNIGLLRTAINTIDYFIKSKVPSLLYRFIFAIAQGIIQGTIDVTDLYQGKTINLSPTLKNVELSYSDHLRLFLLMKKEEELLKSVKNLMNINIQNITDEDMELKDFYTGAEIKVKVYIKLWILDIIGELGVWDKSFHKDGYIYEKVFYRYY